jgi:hypothetical protein
MRYGSAMARRYGPKRPKRVLRGMDHGLLSQETRDSCVRVPHGRRVKVRRQSAWRRRRGERGRVCGHNTVRQPRGASSSSPCANRHQVAAKSKVLFCGEEGGDEGRRRTMSFSMQAFLSARAELAAEKDPPGEVLAALKTAGFPAVVSATKSAGQAAGEVFLLQFAQPADVKVAPSDGPAAQRAAAVLHIVGSELGSSPIFSTSSFASPAAAKSALVVASAAGVAVPRLWMSGELVRRGALRRLGWFLVEHLPGAGAGAATSCTLPATAATAGLPRSDDVLSLLGELRRLAVVSGATELDAHIARLASACIDHWKLTPAPPRLIVPGEGEQEEGGGSAAAVELEAVQGGMSSTAAWASAVAGDGRVVDAQDEPWNLIRAFCHVVKARWLVDQLRRAPGKAPRCDLDRLLQAHDAAQVLLVEREWLPKTIIAPGSSSARLAQTFPHEICPNY